MDDDCHGGIDDEVAGGGGGPPASVEKIKNCVISLFKLLFNFYWYCMMMRHNKQ